MHKEWPQMRILGYTIQIFLMGHLLRPLCLDEACTLTVSEALLVSFPYTLVSVSNFLPDETPSYTFFVSFHFYFLQKKKALYILIHTLCYILPNRKANEKAKIQKFMRSFTKKREGEGERKCVCHWRLHTYPTRNCFTQKGTGTSTQVHEMEEQARLPTRVL